MELDEGRRNPLLTVRGHRSFFLLTNQKSEHSRQQHEYQGLDPSPSTAPGNKKESAPPSKPGDQSGHGFHHVSPAKMLP